MTTTTHKTLRGPRGGLILSSEEFASEHKLNKAVFPGIQGGPLMHVIAAKAICFLEDMKPEYGEYCGQIVKNAKALSEGLMNRGIDLVSGGTDNHLMLVDLVSLGKTGREMEAALEKVNITVNKNTIPNDPRSPFVTSGLRLGTPAVTTRGLKEQDLDLVAETIAMVLKDADKNSAQALKNVKSLTDKYPLVQ